MSLWAKKYDRCVVCEGTDRKHYGHGMCARCYNNAKYVPVEREVWSRKHKKCTVCGTTEKQHASHGRCVNCAAAYQRVQNKAGVHARSRRYYEKNREKVIRRSQLDKNGIGINLRTGGKCATCGTQTDLQVHHLDHRGHNVCKRERNNDPENLMILCIRCHGRLHSLEGNAIKRGVPREQAFREAQDEILGKVYKGTVQSYSKE